MSSDCRNESLKDTFVMTTVKFKTMDDYYNDYTVLKD